VSSPAANNEAPAAEFRALHIVDWHDQEQLLELELEFRRCDTGEHMSVTLAVDDALRLAELIAYAGTLVTGAPPLDPAAGVGRDVWARN
jgi:hypothetical protein